jgi:hypothetical protein
MTNAARRGPQDQFSYVFKGDMLRLPIRIFHVPLPQKRVSGLLARFMSTRAMAPRSTPWVPDKYPVAERSDHVDVYKSAARGEVRVADPYQWMEEDSDKVDKWTSAQEIFTRSYLDKNGDRQRLEDAFRASMDYAKVSAPILYCVMLHLILPLVLRSLVKQRRPLVLVSQQRSATTFRRVREFSTARTFKLINIPCSNVSFQMRNVARFLSG